jgi:hypothetical protein
MTHAEPRQSVDNITVLLGVVTIVSGVATGLFSDLRLLGQLVGLFAFAAWAAAIGLILWDPKSEERADAVTRAAQCDPRCLRHDSSPPPLCVRHRPRLSSRTLVVTPSGSQVVNATCPGAVHGSEVASGIALGQLEEEFVHIELIEPRCERSNKDIRIRSEDLRAVLPSP